MKTMCLLVLLSLSAGCAYLQQPSFPDDVPGVEWRKRIGAYRGV